MKRKRRKLKRRLNGQRQKKANLYEQGWQKEKIWMKKKKKKKKKKTAPLSFLFHSTIVVAVSFSCWWTCSSCHWSTFKQGQWDDALNWALWVKKKPQQQQHQQQQKAASHKSCWCFTSLFLNRKTPFGQFCSSAKGNIAKI